LFGGGGVGGDHDEALRDPRDVAIGVVLFEQRDLALLNRGEVPPTVGLEV
jgi:hypothetical protein